MDYEEARQTLRNGYIDGNLKILNENENEITFEYFDHQYVLTSDEISEYTRMSEIFPSIQVLPVECSICTPTFREHVIEVSDIARRRPYFLHNDEICFGDPSSEDIYVSIGRASDLFINYFRFSQSYFTLCLERFRRPMIGDRRNNEIRNHLYRPLTLKVHNLKESNADATNKRTGPLINACLFELSYLKNVTYTLSEGWNARQPRIKPFSFGDQISGDNLPLPSASFNEATVRFFQRGISTEDPVNQFLSFYQVLEYHFLGVSDEQLYGRLSRIINDPKFTTNPKNLDRIIQEVTKHKRETDETEMLKAVLNKFTDESELLEFIRAYEGYIGKDIYTKKRTLFGEEIQVSTSSGYIIPSVAKVIKAIRNALVHSSDRYERKDRFIPTKASERLVAQEIPLIRYLAEKVIIATAQ